MHTKQKHGSLWPRVTLSRACTVPMISAVIQSLSTKRGARVGRGCGAESLTTAILDNLLFPAAAAARSPSRVPTL